MIIVPVAAVATSSNCGRIPIGASTIPLGRRERIAERLRSRHGQKGVYELVAGGVCSYDLLKQKDLSAVANGSGRIAKWAEVLLRLNRLEMICNVSDGSRPRYKRGVRGWPSD